MKYPKENLAVLGVLGLIQVIFIVIAIVKHDWFYLAVSYVLNSNVTKVINYDGEESNNPAK